MGRLSFLKKAFSLVPSLWMVAIPLFCIIHFIPSDLGNLLLHPTFRFFVMAFVVICIFLFCLGFSGWVVDILLDEEKSSLKESLVEGIAQGWGVGFLGLLLVFGIDFSRHLIFGEREVFFPLIFAALLVPFSFLLSSVLIAKKKRKIDESVLLKKFSFVGLFFWPFVFMLVVIGVVFALLFIKTYVPFFALLSSYVLFQIYLFVFIVCAAFAIEGLGEKEKSQPFKLILINPVFSGILSGLAATFFRLYPPFFVVLRALTPKCYRIKEYNRLLWQGRFYESDALVAISCFTSNCVEAYHIASEYCQRGSKVIMGGPHVSFFPDEALNYCDSVVVGQVEDVWETILADYEAGTLQRIYHGSASEEKAQYVLDYMKHCDPLMLTGGIETSRGCKFNCYFCAVPALSGKSFLRASIEDVVAIAKNLRTKKVPLIFIDSNIYINPEYAKKLFRALIPLKIEWAASVSLDIAKDDEALSLLKQSGCRQLLIGYEMTPSEDNKKYGKKFEMANDYVALTRKLQKAGVGVKGQFIFGFPTDNWMTLFDLWWLSLRLGAGLSALSILTPFPGARFFNDVSRKGSFVNLNWATFNIHTLLFRHPRFGTSFLLRNCSYIIAVIFVLTSSRSIVKLVMGLVIFKLAFSFIFGS